MGQELTKPTIEKLEEIIGDKELVLFFLAWLKNKRNATKAYLELHPEVTYDSARALGSERLTKINISAVLAIYGLDPEAYFKQLKEGLKANRKRAEISERDADGRPIYIYVDEPDHATRREYHEILGKLLGFEKGGNETMQQFNQQNNFYNLTDEQLDRLIESKRRQIGIVSSTEGEGTQNSGESVEIR